MDTGCRARRGGKTDADHGRPSRELQTGISHRIGRYITFRVLTMADIDRIVDIQIDLIRSGWQRENSLWN
jgi:ATP-dependent Clp protease ATP-binding subunit ClpA